MKLLYASDIHTNRQHLGTLLDMAKSEGVGAVVIGGDITPKDIFHTHRMNKLVAEQRKYLADEFVPALRSFQSANPVVKLFLDLGNDDFSANRDVLETAEAEGLFNLLHMRVHPLTDDLDIAGFMDVPVTPFSIKDYEKPDKRGELPPTRHALHGYVSVKTGGIGLQRHTINVAKDTSIEEELAELGKKITKPFLFVSHAPPYLTNLDMLINGEHVGSKAVRDFIEKWASAGLLKASFHGHIHESPRVSGSSVDYVAGVECHNFGQEEGTLKYGIYEVPGPANLLAPERP